MRFPLRKIPIGDIRFSPEALKIKDLYSYIRIPEYMSDGLSGNTSFTGLFTPDLSDGFEEAWDYFCERRNFYQDCTKSIWCVSSKESNILDVEVYNRFSLMPETLKVPDAGTWIQE